MSATAAARDDILLTCTPGKDGDHLIFDYAVANQGGVPAYVMDVLPGIHPRTGAPTIDADAVSVWLEPDGIVQILKGVPEMPEGQDPQHRIVPLAVQLAPGERITRHLSQPSLLAEHSPYVPLGHLGDYRLRPIQGIALAVDVIPASAPGFIAVKAAGYPPGLFRLIAQDDVLLLRRLACAFQTRGLHVLAHAGDYPRPTP
jgi:hypothetical protein